MMQLKIMLTTIILTFANFGYSQNLPVVSIETTLGTIFCEIDTIHAPVTAHNFLNHIQKDTYKNTVFYRVVRQDNQPASKTKIEVIQGGLFADEEIDKIKPIIHETTKETGIKHLDGTLSMARNEPGTASTEFFICVGNQPELDFEGKRNPDGQGFAAFGKVIKGMVVVRKIQVQKDKNQYLVEPVRILKMELVK
jgi:peptidyl-prolyl cis-trans isomerase A (cyclophilin A)